MIVKNFYRTRADGVNLYCSIDVKVDEEENPIRDENGKLIPTGFKIRKLGTKEIYNRAIDVEGADFTYVETDIPIDKPKKETEENIRSI